MSLALLARRRPCVAADTPPPRSVAVGRKVFQDLDRVESLPHLSDSAVQAMTLANSADSTLAEMTNVIRRDGMMAAAVLKLANSAVYRGSGEVTDLAQAVVRIGFKGCGQLLSGIGMKSIYHGHPPAVQAGCETVLKHSLLVATLASAVRRVLFLDLNGEEFTAGLLHDIGRVVMCCKAADEYLSAGLPEHDEAADLLELEREAFGSDHCAVGSLFAMKNNLPARITRVILNHHEPAEEQEDRQLVALIALCDALANHMQLDHNLTGFAPDADAGYTALAATLPADRLARLRTQLPTVVVHCMKETRSMLRSIYG